MAFTIAQKMKTAFQGVRNRFARQAASQMITSPAELERIKARNAKVAEMAVGRPYQAAPAPKRIKAPKAPKVRKERFSSGAYSMALTLIRQIGDRNVEMLWEIGQPTGRFRSKTHMKKLRRAVVAKYGHFRSKVSAMPEMAMPA